MAFSLCNIIPIPCQGVHGGWSNQPVDSLPTVDSNSNQVKFEFLHFKSGHGDNDAEVQGDQKQLSQIISL